MHNLTPKSYARPQNSGSRDRATPGARSAEALRLGVLRQYAVLDTAPDQALDDLTKLAAHICEVPIAVISLIDEHRQWFKARVGLEATETARDLSFCAHALHHPAVLIVPDATLDARFAENPMVTDEPHIRFYAGAPLITPEGATLGTLCVIDRVPRTLTVAQQDALQVLARQVMAQLELHRQARDLAKSERFLRTIFDSEPECVKVLGPDGSLQMMNPAGLAMIEAESFAQVAGRCVYELCAPEDRAKFVELSERIFQGHSGILEYKIIGLKGGPRWLETHAAPLRDEDGEVTALLGVTRDITRRKQAEEARRASQARYQTLFEYAPDGIAISDSDGHCIDANPSMCEMLGYTHEQLLSLNASDILAPTGNHHIEPALGAIKTGHDCHREWLFRRKDGSDFRAEVVATMMPDGNLLGMIRDITQRKQSEQRFRQLVDSNAQGVMFFHMNGQITGANDAFLAIVGFGREDLDAGRINWVAMTPPEYTELDRECLKEIVAKRTATPFEKEYVRKDGARVPVLISAAVFADSPEAGVCFVLDLTERKKLEEQFLRAQRMESIGALAGGIAHDLNNVLGPIITALELLEMRFSDPASKDLIDIISCSAQRGADMVRQVLSFARGVKGRRMELQIGHLVREIEKIANETFLKHIRVRTTIPRDLWIVLGDPTQLQQVLLNLCVNARDAMLDGGTLTISAENVTLDADYVGLNLEAIPGRYIRLQVEDNGIGMPPEIIEKVFDPFYTTKALGKGTGLGLSTSLSIVRSHGGFIEINSKVGSGTIFKVYLPAHIKQSVDMEVGIAPEMPRGKGELILVVDDEVSVREITGRTLQAFGYRVIAAADGAQAVAIYTARGSEIALVLTDIMMPVMSGPSTIEKLQRINPSIRIIAASGLSSNGHVGEVGGFGVRYFLPKPYTTENLLKAMRKTLEADSTVAEPFEQTVEEGPNDSSGVCHTPQQGEFWSGTDASKSVVLG